MGILTLLFARALLTFVAHGEIGVVRDGPSSSFWRLGVVQIMALVLVAALVWVGWDFYKVQFRWAAENVRLSQGRIAVRPHDEPQVVGACCAICAQKIAFAFEGHLCPTRGRPVHLACVQEPSP
jgi:hypothetical protein